MGKYVYAVILIVVIICSKLYIHDVSDRAYKRGYNTANTAWVTKGREYVDIINKQYKENQILGSKLAAESEESRQKLIEKDQQIDKLKDEYRSNPESVKRGLDDTFINIYNKSLEDK